jgi:hypothetical protein
MPRESNMSHNIYILHSEMSYTWMTLPSFGESNSLLPRPHSLKRVIQLYDTNQVHNSDEGCNGHVRYCCNLASVVLCKLSQLNLSETTGLNGTKLFWRTNHRIKKYINGLRIEVPSFYFTFNVDKFPLSFTVSEILLTGRDQQMPISKL